MVHFSAFGEFLILYKWQPYILLVFVLLLIVTVEHVEVD